VIPSAELLDRIARSRDREAFAVLFERYARRIAGFLRDDRLAPSIRDELVQEIMLRVWHRAGQYNPEKASVDSWIFAIVRNARTDHFRRPAVRACVEPLDPGLVDDRTPPVEEEVLRRRDALDLRTALDDLPEEQASILHAAYYQHKSLRTIATETGVALGTVKSRVRLAMKKLRDVLGRHS